MLMGGAMVLFAPIFPRAPLKLTLVPVGLGETTGDGDWLVFVGGASCLALSSSRRWIRGRPAPITSWGSSGTAGGLIRLDGE